MLTHNNGLIINVLIDGNEMQTIKSYQLRHFIKTQIEILGISVEYDE